MVSTIKTHCSSIWPSGS